MLYCYSATVAAVGGMDWGGGDMGDFSNSWILVDIYTATIISKHSGSTTTDPKFDVIIIS